MRYLLLVLCLLVIGSCDEVYALDGSVSLEMDSDAAARHLSPDYTMNIGQTLGNFRPYVAMERTHETIFFPNSDQHYRAGLEWNGLPCVKLESGVGMYQGSTFIYGKATYSFDSKNWRR